MSGDERVPDEVAGERERIAAAVDAERERIAAAIEALRAEMGPFADGHSPCLVDIERAASIARSGGAP